VIKKNTKERNILFLIPLFFLIVFLVLKVNQNNQTQEEVEEVHLRDALGQSFIVGIPGITLDEETKKILEHIKPAGIILYRRNYESYDQLKELISELQVLSMRTNQSSYFIMLDEEPEGAFRIGLLKNVFSLGFPEWEKIEDDIKLLSEIGINVILAPLADFPFNENAFVRRRIPVETPEDLIAFNNVFIDLLKENGISATLKHFPGLGLFEEDPHQEKIYSRVNDDVFQDSLEIFKQGIKRGPGFVMTSHAVYENVDPEKAATFSSIIVKDILINTLNFDGIVITDDLSDMPLITDDADLVKATIKSIQAGHHLVMFSHKLDYTKEIFEELLIKLEKDIETQEKVRENYELIKNKKKTLIEK
jgi:beta-N-acetylhexosaminidase